MGRRIYTPEMLEFIRTTYAEMSLANVVLAFNTRFDLKFRLSQIKSALKNHDITCGGRAKLMPLRLYTKEQAAWLKDNYHGRGYAEIAGLFNAKFGMKLTVTQVKSFTGNHKLDTGLTGYYGKGSVPWNKGLTGYIGPNATSFKKGDIPQTKRQLWSQRISKDGYIEISVPERNPHTGAATRFKSMHLWLWECMHGQLPKGHAIIFVDSNNRNFSPDNLLCVTRAELLSLNQHNYKDQPAEVKPSILALARLEAKAGIRSTGRVPGSGRKRRSATQPKE